MTTQTQSTAEQPDLATAIVKIQDALERLLKSGLNRHAVVTLVKADTGVPKRDIEAVFDSLATLAKTYTKPKG